MCRSAFFFFCQEFRSVIKKQNPSYGIGEISKLLGHQWETIGDKSKYESQAAKDKARYEKVILCDIVRYEKVLCDMKR